MSSSITYIKELIRKGSRAESFSRRKVVDKNYYRQRQRATQSQIKLQKHDSNRECITIPKKDNEAFGFEIRTYNEKLTNSCEEDVFTCVCSVRENSPAENAGLRAGDVIIIVNSICVEGFEHQQIVDLIQNACLLKMEIVRGTTVKLKEMQKKLHHLEWQLNEKWAELQKLITQEERLLRGDQRSTHSDSCPPSEPLTLPIPLC
ncbi:cytohesin-interacting protein [Hoplias malabaricus]|uniref:cytohesin-interacting protein n=1 Tax=Hoplias malabaricus TaxID=27720 RepID=UPI0034625D8C